MPKQKRQRIDSAAAAVVMMQKSLAKIQPPPSVPLQECDMPFFNNVIDEFARSEWTAHQLELAAMLARTMADLEREQRLLREEGSMMFTDKGTPVVNPRKTIVQMNAGTILSYRRSLSLHARAQGGDARDIGARRSAAKMIEADNPLEDDLLARPN